MAFTNGNDINILQGTDLSSVGAGAGNDRYVLDASILNPGQRITISDSQGLNTFQLSGGLVITSSLVANDAVQLTLNNGAVITVLGASSFNFQTGGNPINGTGGTTQNYSAFVTASLGVAGGVPAAGAAPAAGGTATVLANGGTTVGGGGIPGATYALVAGATSADEGTTATFELTTTNVVAGTEVAYTLSGIDAADLASGALTGKAMVGADGKATISVALAADSKTEGAETLTVTAGGATASTTVNDTSVGLTFTLAANTTQVNEGDAAKFTVTASKAVAVDTEVTFQLALGTAQLADFNAGAFNPAKVIIKAGQTSATHAITAITNDGTELTETYAVSATVGGASVGTVNMSILDGAVGAGQTFTLTTGLDFIPGMTGSNGNTVTAGNDIIVAVDGAGATLNATDQIDGGQGIDTLKVFTDGVAAVTVGAVSNVEIIELSSAGAAKINTSTIAGITNLTVTKVGAGKVIDATAGATTDVTVGLKAAGAAVGVVGGNNVTVKLTDVAAAADVVTIGAGTAAKGNVVVEMTGAKTVAAANATLSAVAVTGGKSISVTQKATSDATAAGGDKAGATITQGAITATGDALTTTVTVKQDATVAATLATSKSGGVTETASVKFSALTAGQTLDFGGLKFTLDPAQTMTANEAAATFANLVQNATFGLPANIAAGDTQSGGAASKGTYKGDFTGWTSGAAAGDTVVFTSTAPNSNPGDLANAGTGTATITTTQGKANDAPETGGVLGVTAGSVTVADAAGSIKTVTVDGYGAASAVTGGAVLTDLSLANGGAFTAANAAAALNLTLEKVNGLYTQTAGAATLNVKSVGANTAGLAAANTKSLNVSGTGLLNASAGSVLTALTSIKVTESAGLNLGATALGAVTSVDASGTTGAMTVAIDSTKATYAGGAGADSVTFTNTTAATKALDLGAGNDTLVFAAGTVAASTVMLKGGLGTDTVSMVAADAVTASASTAFGAQLDSFERLTVTGAVGAQTIDLGKLGFTNYVTVAGAGTLTLTDLANNGTVLLTGNNTEVIVAMKDAATSLTDVLNVTLSSSGALAAGTLTATKVETINLTATDTDTTAHVDTLTLKADTATTLTIVGNANVALTLDTATTKLASIDGSAMTGALQATGNGVVATTIKGGAGTDVLTAGTGTTADVLMGGAGNDVLVSNKGLSTLTGGAGNDVFRIAAASLDANSYSTITDFAAGDLLQIAGAVNFVSAKVTLGNTAVFQDFANAAINLLAANEAGWFQFGGDTYVVADKFISTAFVNGTDLVVKLTGLVDFTNASFNTDDSTIAL